MMIIIGVEELIGLRTRRNLLREPNRSILVTRDRRTNIPKCLNLNRISCIILTMIVFGSS